MKRSFNTIACATFVVAALGPAEAVLAQHAGIAQSAHPYVLVDRTLGSGEPWELHLVQTSDEIYVPVGVRKPEGDGPFPVILIGSGQGTDGMGKIDRSMVRFRELMSRLVDRGYVAVFVSYRNEVPELYNEIADARLLDDTVSGGSRTLRSVPALDSDDHLAIIEHAKALPYTDPDAVGAIGSSHSGEIIMKTATNGNWLTAAVPSEAAVIEYLAVDITDAPRDPSGRELQLRDTATVKALADRDRAMARLREVDTPLLVLGRDNDHLQGLFRLLYEWGTEAGADMTWRSFDHPVHGYSLLGRGADESFETDPVEEQAFELYMGFFDEHLR
ncbi:MAG TPA: hypothetical protein VIV14_12480 [Gammaproteobacteria bacterium]